jgi:ectoine hydroxylase-related dioxygenase (phytanoyl-CoA dioxygenase family)
MENATMARILTSEQVRDYQRDGILFPLPALTAAEAARSLQAFRTIAACLETSPRQGFGQWHLCFRCAHDLATHPAILDLVEDVLGPDILVHSSTLFHKPARSRNYVSWHQDGHYWQLDAPRLTSAWIALTPSTPGNGCLRVLPGSHAAGRVLHNETPHQDNLLNSGLRVAAPIDESRAIDVCLAPGELSLHHVDLIHGSGANSSDVDRLGFAVRYASPSVRQVRVHHAVVLARGRDEFGHFQHLTERPSESLEEGLAAQAEIATWLKRNLRRGGPSAQQKPPTV